MENYTLADYASVADRQTSFDGPVDIQKISDGSGKFYSSGSKIFSSNEPKPLPISLGDRVYRNERDGNGWRTDSMQSTCGNKCGCSSCVKGWSPVTDTF
ncbi:MAG: hypothetical protein JKX76_00770 [Colwellia sp.]|nr:hypothetical protein [Colwellia sp.]